MPSKKKKYNARFPAGRIKKIMQTDEEVGKVAQAVPVIISRTLELFVESLLTKSMQITQARNAKTLTPSHMKQCILSESRFDFLKDLVKNVPDASVQEDNENNALCEEVPLKIEESPMKMEEQAVPLLVPKNPRGRPRDKHPPHTEVTPMPVNEQSASSSRAPVIQYGPKIVRAESTIKDFSVNSLLKEKPELQITIASAQLPVPQLGPLSATPGTVSIDNVPPLIPISHFSQNTSDSLSIDEDYDN